MKRLTYRAASIVAFLAGSAAVSGQEPLAPPEVDAFEGLEFRLVGPSRGGRVTAVAGHVAHPYTFYMGSTGGGVWRTTNAGVSWENLTDEDFRAGSVGAVTVAPSDPNVLYVGMGSACPRGNVSIGDGMYRSTDAGASWEHIGLERSGSISRVRVHPDDPNVLWVGVLGQIFGSNPERGVYRSTDGGDTWQQVLSISDDAGIADLELDPFNPRVLYAAAWRVERKPWTLIDGSDEGGLFRSTDGGDSWHRLEGGLPSGVLGRIGVSASPARRGRLWTIITAADGRGGIFRSEDHGDTWKKVSDEPELLTRGWYYSHIHADPADPNTVWGSNVRFFRSVDGGANWERVPTPHGDNHDIWINPERPHIIVQANDGGANVSVDGGRSWSTQNNQPTAEFYRVTVDNQFPYRIYGAQQDNSTISVPSRPMPELTPTEHWHSVAGAESGHIAVHPEQPHLVYSGNYLGRIDRYDHRSGISRNMILYPEMQDGTAPRDLRYRFQWNAPILISRHDPDVVYHTSNYVHRTRDGGWTWETISPDLTTDDDEKQGMPGGPVQHDHTGVEVYNTVFALAESPRRAGEIWAGSDDGRIHVSRDNGGAWIDVTPAAMPADGTVNSIDVSRHDPDRIYLAAYRYRMNDYTPYIFRTEDGGASWTTVTSGLPENHFVRVVREDPGADGLLFAGTEFGLYASFDRGDTWQSFQLNLPRTPVTDLTLHENAGNPDLVLATQGRSFWVLDDLNVVRELARELAAGGGRDTPRLFAPETTVRVDRPGRGGGFVNGASIWFHLPGAADRRVELTITPEGGDRVLRRFLSEPEDEADQNRDRDDERPRIESFEAETGLNRVVWDLKDQAPHLVEGAIMSLSYTGGPFLPPGTYRATLGVEPAGEASDEEAWGDSRTFEIVGDPRLDDVTQEDLEEQYEMLDGLSGRLTAVHDAIAGLRSVREQAEALGDRLDAAGAGELESAVAEVAQRADELNDRLIQARSRVSQDALNFPPRIDNQYAYLYTHVFGNTARPTAGARRRFEDLEADLVPILEAVDELTGPRLEDLNRRARELEVPAVQPPTSREANRIPAQP